MSEHYKGVMPGAGHESGNPGANEKKTMTPIKPAEIICTPEHQIADLLPTLAVPLHSPSRPSSPSGDVSVMLPCVCLKVHVGIKLYSCDGSPFFHNCRKRVLLN